MFFFENTPADDPSRAVLSQRLVQSTATEKPLVTLPLAQGLPVLLITDTNNDINENEVVQSSSKPHSRDKEPSTPREYANTL